MSRGIHILYKDDPLRQVFLEILKSNGIPQTVKTITMVDPPELKGKHFATTSVYINVKFKDEFLKKKNLFVKLIPSHPQRAATTRQMKYMDKESAFFTQFLPELRGFCKRFKGCENLLQFFPKCLYGDENILVMENVVLDDTFFMINENVGQDLQASKLVLSNLADFHAASFAYILDHGGVENFRQDWELVCREVMLYEESPMIDAMMENGLNNCIHISKSYPVEGGDGALGQLTSFTGAMRRTIMGVMRPEMQGKCQVVNHGDCWNNNMLFKRNEKTGDLEDHVFVDLQVTRLGSPCLDLGYYLYLSVRPEVRRRNFQELMKHYYTRFEETLGKLGRKCPITFEELLDDYKDKFQLGFFTGLTMMSAIGSMKEMDLENLPDVQDAVLKMFLDAMKKWIDKNPEQSFQIANEIVALLKEKEDLQKM